jgi:hypothetical protein
VVTEWGEVGGAFSRHDCAMGGLFAAKGMRFSSRGDEMGQFFVEGGWGMYPVLVLSLILVACAGRYAFDSEPVRLRFITALSLTLLAFIVGSVTAGAAKVFWYLESPERVPDAMLPRIFAEGMKECSRPAVLGLPLLGLALILVCIGVYRDERRELAAARG